MYTLFLLNNDFRMQLLQADHEDEQAACTFFGEMVDKLYPEKNIQEYYRI